MHCGRAAGLALPSLLADMSLAGWLAGRQDGRGCPPLQHMYWHDTHNRTHPSLSLSLSPTPSRDLRPPLPMAPKASGIFCLYCTPSVLAVPDGRPKTAPKRVLCSRETPPPGQLSIDVLASLAVCSQALFPRPAPSRAAGPPFLGLAGPEFYQLHCPTPPSRSPRLLLSILSQFVKSPKVHLNKWHVAAPAPKPIPAHLLALCIDADEPFARGSGM